MCCILKIVRTPVVKQSLLRGIAHFAAAGGPLRRSFSEANQNSLTFPFWCVCLTKSEPILSETDAPPRRQPPQSGGLPRRKTFFTVFDFAFTTNFFLLKEKESFSARLRAQARGRRGFASGSGAAEGGFKGGIPPRPRLRERRNVKSCPCPTTPVRGQVIGTPCNLLISQAVAVRSFLI